MNSLKTVGSAMRLWNFVLFKVARRRLRGVWPIRRCGRQPVCRLPKKALMNCARHFDLCEAPVKSALVEQFNFSRVGFSLLQLCRPKLHPSNHNRLRRAIPQ